MAAPAGARGAELLVRIEDRLLRNRGEVCASPELLEDLAAFFNSRTLPPSLNYDLATQGRIYSLWLPEAMHRALAKRVSLDCQLGWRDQLIKQYFVELGLPWVIGVLRALRSDDPQRLAALSRLEARPRRLRRYGPGGASEATSGVRYLNLAFFDDRRAREIAGHVTLVARKLGLPLRGRRLCDMGTAIGTPLVYYERAVGTKGRVYAVDIDGIAMDFVAFQIEKGVLKRTKVVLGKPNDCCLPPGSVDVMVLTGVHMGGGLDPAVLPRTREWLCSMARALGPGGHLVMDEANPYTREEILWAFKPTGLKLRKWFLVGRDLGGEPGISPTHFVAVFQK